MKPRMLVMIACGLAVCAGTVRAELIEYDDAGDSVLAAAMIGANDATGWNDPSIYVGVVFGYRYHILVAIKDTAAIQSLFTDYVLDSAHLSVVVSALAGSPGDLTVHRIQRDSTGVGVYPAYDDLLSVDCRSRWYQRKGAAPSGCANPIYWETPGATGPSDYDSVAFATITNPTVGQRYAIDVTEWIAGIVNGAATQSNGIMMLATNDGGAGTDFVSIRHIHPFFAGDDRMILQIWRSQPGAEHLKRAWIDNPDQLK